MFLSETEMRKPKKDLVQERWRIAAADGLPYKITFSIVEYCKRSTEVPPYIPSWAVRPHLLKEAGEILGERRVHWRQAPIDPDTTDGSPAKETLIIFSADDDWLVRAKLLGATLTQLPLIVEKWNDPAD